MSGLRSLRARHDGAMLGGRYRLAEVIGRGAMSEVRAARDVRLGREVAVKLLLHENLDGQPAVRRRFEDEARIACRLDGPHVVSTFDMGEHEGVPYIVLERLPGSTLRDELRDAPLPAARARTVALQVLQALELAHRSGIVHRDVKPENLLLAASGDVKVGDFGIAKVAESSHLTMTGTFLGTPAYLAPEVVAGAEATPASDLYALGVVLYEMLSGARPFNAPTPLALCHAITTADPRPLRDVQPSVDAQLDHVVRRAMAKDPEQRYSSATEMMREVEDGSSPSSTSPFARDHASYATTVRMQLPTATLVEPVPMRPRPRDVARVTRSPRPPTANRRVQLLVAALFVAVAVGTGVEHWDGRAPSAPPRRPAGVPTATVPLPLARALDRLQAATLP